MSSGDPPRFETEGPAALRALVRAHKSGPADEALERMSRRLDEALAAATAVPAGVAPRRLLPFKLAAFALVLAIAGAFVTTWRVSTPSPVRSTLDRAAPAEAPPELAKPAETPTTIAVDELPRAASAPPAAMRAPAASELGQGSGTELDVIQRAQTALATDPRRALAITSEHARRYPSGEFVQEREVIAVEALVKMGEREAASRRATALAQNFPNTPYATRLEKALGRPLSARPAASDSPNAAP